MAEKRHTRVFRCGDATCRVALAVTARMFGMARRPVGPRDDRIILVSALTYNVTTTTRDRGTTTRVRQTGISNGKQKRW